jgi:protein subunit release factor B
VQIKHLPTGIVIKCQETRSRDQNEKIAVRKLQDRLEEMEKGEESRLAKRRELLRKRKRNREKKARRKYRALEEEGRRETKRDVEVRGGDAESENIGVDGAQPTDAEGAAENSQHDQDRVSRPGTNPGDNG